MVKILDVTPGNLWNHLVRLRDKGYVDIKYVLADRPRRVITITNKGADETLRLLNEIMKILKYLKS